ncbi:MAG: glucosamine-6-phosphate deaminase [Spirochaetaceae bacterium]|nr:glucosamine-6-phosphate deaminase [Spirochaetaceae bacterium]
MKLVIRENYAQASEYAANYISERINNYKGANPFVLGLPTGSTPLGTYKKLIELNKGGKVSFKNIITFNMDEYVALPKEHPESYYSFMYNNFFNHIDINKANINILDGNAENPEEECAAYEAKITKAGGIELFLGGVGIDGHIAFNEPGSSLSALTHKQKLTQDTIIANSRFFDNDVSKVPNYALTVGVGTVMNSNEVILLVTGHNKARALRHIIDEPMNHQWTSSALQLHKNAVIICDEAAVAELKVATYRYFKELY